MYSIGEFSKMTALSIKSLRLYHEKGLLIPAKVEEFSNYRYYSDHNFDTARTIKILKNLDFSLAEIKEILDECNEEADILEQLEHKLAFLQERIRHFQEVSQSIQMVVKNEREARMQETVHFEIEEKSIDTILIAGHRMKGRYDEVGKAYALIGKKMGRYICGKPMTLFYDGEYKEKDADYEGCYPIRKGSSQSDISVRELPGGKCVSLVHKGPYDNLGKSYKKIFDYINEKGYKVILPHREIYIKGPGMIFKGNPNNYLTELVLMIE